MIALDLQAPEFDAELADQIFKLVVIVIHKLIRDLLLQHLSNVFVWLLEVLKQQNEDFLLVSRNLDQEDLSADFVEISVQHSPFRLDTMLIVTNIQWWGSFLGYDAD